LAKGATAYLDFVPGTNASLASCRVIAVSFPVEVDPGATGLLGPSPEYIVAGQEGVRMSRRRPREEDDSPSDGMRETSSCGSQPALPRLFQLTTEGILIADPKTRVVSESGECRACWVQRRKSFVAMGVEDIHSRSPPSVVSTFDSLATRAQVAVPAIPATAQDGSILYATLWPNPVTIDGQVFVGRALHRRDRTSSDRGKPSLE